MNQPIEFPKDFERFVRLGKVAIENGELLKATEHFSAAYETEQDFSINMLLVSTLLEIGEVKEAFDYAKEMVQDYNQSVSHLGLYIQVLVQNRLFIEATSLIEGKKGSVSVEEEALLNEYLEQVKQTEQAYQQLEFRRIKEIMKELIELSTLDYFAQIQTIKKIETLPTQNFEEIAQHLLINDQLHQLVRSKILEELVHIKSQKMVEFLWLDEKIYQVQPDCLTLPEKTQAYQSVSAELEKRLINDNPSLLLNLMNEVHLQFALLFPFADEKVSNPHLWALNYLAEQGEDIPGTPVELEADWQPIQQLKNQLQNLILQLYLQE
ncbi:hypothetical protein IGI37_001443 [Enterococcus sp. AZ194]|uniref:hypothetical protein n=1 Tax=Enterococcus sp. AZ194 TaxID=2774629 RepID=UPI003F299285